MLIFDYWFKIVARVGHRGGRVYRLGIVPPDRALRSSVPGVRGRVGIRSLSIGAGASRGGGAAGS